MREDDSLTNSNNQGQKTDYISSSLEENIISNSLDFTNWINAIGTSANRNSSGFKQKVNTTGSTKPPSLLPKAVSSILTKLSGRTLVEILEVDQSNFDESFFWGAWLDAPRAGDKFEGSAIRIAGWAMPRETNLSLIKVFFKDRLISKVPINRQRPDVSAAYCINSDIHHWGYDAQISLKEAPHRGNLLIQASCSDGSEEFLSFIKYQKY